MKLQSTKNPCLNRQFFAINSTIKQEPNDQIYSQNFTLFTCHETFLFGDKNQIDRLRLNSDTQKPKGHILFSTFAHFTPHPQTGASLPHRGRRVRVARGVPKLLQDRQLCPAVPSTIRRDALAEPRTPPQNCSDSKLQRDPMKSPRK